MLGEGSQSQKDKHDVTALARGAKGRQIHRNGSQMEVTGEGKEHGGYTL